MTLWAGKTLPSEHRITSVKVSCLHRSSTTAAKFCWWLFHLKTNSSAAISSTALLPIRVFSCFWFRCFLKSPFEGFHKIVTLVCSHIQLIFIRTDVESCVSEWQLPLICTNSGSETTITKKRIKNQNNGP